LPVGEKRGIWNKIGTKQSEKKNMFLLEGRRDMRRRMKGD